MTADTGRPYGVRHGTMLNFVWRRLKEAGVSVQSQEALGRQLHEMRKMIAKKAALERLKQVTTDTIGRFVVTVRR